MDKCGWNAGAQAGTGSGKGAREALCCRTRGVLARQSSEFWVYGRWPSPKESYYTQKIDIVRRMRAADLGRRMRPTRKTDDRSGERRGRQVQDEVNGMMAQMSESRPLQNTPSDKAASRFAQRSICGGRAVRQSEFSVLTGRGRRYENQNGNE